MRQRFFSPKGYVPKVYGYVLFSCFKDEPFCLDYYRRVRGLSDELPLHTEPPSQKCESLTFARRTQGQKLLKLLQPEDHLIAYSADRISISLQDFMFAVRWFYEHGIHLHLCDFWGTPLDLWSTPGRMVMDSLALSSEVAGFWQKKARRAVKESKPAKQYHKGKQIPWYCEIFDGEHLRFRSIAYPLLIAVCDWRDREGWSWSRISERMQDDWEAMTGVKIAAFKGKAKEAIDAYCFYKGWAERGFCDLNATSPAEIKAAYRAKLFPSAGADGGTDDEVQGSPGPSVQ